MERNHYLSGLAYSTTYKVWVNATDPTGSGLYTRDGIHLPQKEIAHRCSVRHLQQMVQQETH